MSRLDAIRVRRRFVSEILGEYEGDTLDFVVALDGLLTVLAFLDQVVRVSREFGWTTEFGENAGHIFCRKGSEQLEGPQMQLGVVVVVVVERRP